MIIIHKEKAIKLFNFFFSFPTIYKNLPGKNPNIKTIIEYKIAKAKEYVSLDKSLRSVIKGDIIRIGMTINVKTIKVTPIALINFEFISLSIENRLKTYLYSPTGIRTWVYASKEHHS